MSSTAVRHAKRYRPKATVFVASDHADAKRKVRRLAADIGFDSVDAGDLKNARYTEPLAMLWGALVLDGHYGESLAFRAMHAT
jgi:predicted dinucleotide-binding enzyme